MLIVLKIFKKFTGQKNNQQSSLEGEKVEINPHIILLVQMAFQIHLIFPLNLFQNLSILPNQKKLCNQPLCHWINFY